MAPRAWSSLAEFAHASNQAYVAAATAGRGRRFVPDPPIAVYTRHGLAPLLTEPDGAPRRFLRYRSANGWNNQLLDLLCAAEMARLLNRTLVVPPFAWRRRRGNASVSVGRLVDLLPLAHVTPIVAEDEAGGVGAALRRARLSTKRLRAEGYSHRTRHRSRWEAGGWVARHGDEAARVLDVRRGILFWTWRLSDDAARELLAALEYHPTLVHAATAASAHLGPRASAIHVRRGDKSAVDATYRPIWSKMTPGYFLQLMGAEGINKSAAVYVATDELDRAWFDPIAAAGYRLTFADQLAQPPLLAALQAFPQPLWVDVLSIIEQIVCVRARRFVGTLPSTMSGYVTNLRIVRGLEADSNGVPRPLFTKLAQTCCDAATARDVLRLPGVATLADVPCVPHEGNAWC